MLGNIISTDGNKIIIDLKVDINKIHNLINLYVIMEDDDKKFVGEIIDIKGNNAIISLLGELIDDKFVFGIMSKPAFSAKVKLISKEKAPLIIGINNYEEDRHLYIGESPIYENVKIGMDVNSFFSNHFAIFGSTGSGKSCSIARIFQNLFSKEKMIPYRASIFVFDAYGEYHNAFKDLHKKVPEINFKAYTTNVNSDTELLRIPIWLLDTDDIAILLGVEKPSQIPIIEKALKLVTIFGREESVVLKHKNDIIARAILEILSSGRQSTQIRDQIFSVLTRYNTSELNLETKVFQPGYVRSLKQCLLIDSSGKMREMELLVSFIEKYEKNKMKAIIYTKEYFHDKFKEKEDILKFYECMVYFYRDILNYKTNGQVIMYEDYIDLIKYVANNNTIDQIINKLDVIINCESLVKYNLNTGLLVDRMIIDMEGLK